MGHGCISDRHPLLLGQTGFGALRSSQKNLMCNVILALGTRFAEANNSSWYKGDL